MGMPMRWEAEAVPQNPIVPLTPLKPKSRASRRRNRVRLFFAVSLFAALSAAGGVAAQKTVEALRPAPDLKLEKSGSASQVALTSASVERNLGFVTITGSVTNQQAQNLPQVEAVAELLDAQQHPVQMETALVGAQALGAKADAPFQIVLPDNTNAVSYRVRFRQLAGPNLN